MANNIGLANIDPGQFVTPTSRYSTSQVIYYTNLNKITFSIYRRINFIPSSEDKFMIITKGVEFRPDLVSNRVYGFPDYWWKIMEANNMKDVFEFKSGVNIRIPNPTVINI